MVQLSDDLVKRLDEEAQERGVSRSALIRSVLTDFLKTESLQAKIERYIEGYRRMPPPTIDEWGNLDEQGVRDGARMMREFEAEEEAAGFSW
jgi:Ribbon-helix-helix protein, copG family